MKTCSPQSDVKDVSFIELNSRIDTESLLSPPRSLLGQKFIAASRPRLRIVILGRSTTSLSDGQAAIYRGLIRELSARGHDVLFLEWLAEGHADDDLAEPPFGRTGFYSNVKELKDRFTGAIREADFVVVGSHMSEGIAVGEWVTRTAKGATAFYDLDLPATLANLIKGKADYISPALIPRYQMYLSSTGGPLLEYFEKQYGVLMARPLYASVDAKLFFPEQHGLKWDLGYVGTYSDERQALLDRLLLEPARRWNEGRFVVAGAQYPRSVRWPKNVSRLSQLPLTRQRAFYNSQRFNLSFTSPTVIAAGFSPTVQLFEAAACGTPIISDFWPGIEMFFKPDAEILVSHSPDETLVYLEEISEIDRRRMGYRARENVLARHTTRHRATELERYALQVLKLTAA